MIWIRSPHLEVWPEVIGDGGVDVGRHRERSVESRDNLRRLREGANEVRGE
jgi:hypothetical protein